MQKRDLAWYLPGHNSAGRPLWKGSGQAQANALGSLFPSQKRHDSSFLSDLPGLQGEESDDDPLRSRKRDVSSLAQSLYAKVPARHARIIVQPSPQQPIGYFASLPTAAMILAQGKQGRRKVMAIPGPGQT